MTQDVAAIFPGHDSTISYWNSKNNTYHTIEFERVFNHKRTRIDTSVGQLSRYAQSQMPHPSIKTGEDKRKYGFEKAVEYLKHFGWDGTPFECFILGTHYDPEKANDYSNWTQDCLDQQRWWFMFHEDAVKNYFPAEKYQVVCSHHFAHAASAYYQSPTSITNAYILTADGGGDDGCMNEYEVIDGNIVQLDYKRYNIGRSYSKLGLLLFELKDTFTYDDLPGKVMGYSAYGEFDPDLFFHMKEYFAMTETLEQYENNISIWHNIFKQFESTKNYTRQQIEERMNVTVRKGGDKNFEFEYAKILNAPVAVGAGMLQITSWPYHKPNIFKEFRNELDSGCIIRPKFKHQTHEGLTFMFDREEGMKFAYNAQLAIEDIMLDAIRARLHDIRTKYDNNIILSGGVALNVLTNERIKKVFPNVNVFVPPNPQDAGLSFGALKRYLKKYKENDQKVNITYSGIPFNLDKPWPNKKEITLSDLVNLLKDGKIIGLIQGNSEVGPRALGNRSILCDASYPDMKDIINAKVKHREWFRPFAPVCIKEDAKKYFESSSFENLQFMSFAVKVKDKYKDRLQSITHIDGTARLQTVTREQNAFLYDILKQFNGVLLNTSFNVQGRPILNTSQQALSVLNSTELDYIVHRVENKIYLIGKENE